MGNGGIGDGKVGSSFIIGGNGTSFGLPGTLASGSALPTPQAGVVTSADPTQIEARAT